MISFAFLHALLALAPGVSSHLCRLPTHAERVRFHDICDWDKECCEGQAVRAC